MSVYEGTELEIEYQHGYDDGFDEGSYDAVERPAVVHDVIATQREHIKNAGSRRSRAYLLGWLRGYRLAVSLGR